MIKISALPSTLWKTDIVKNVDDCNYELYLTEFVNASEQFKQITGNKEVRYCYPQSKGEWDCTVNGIPFLDFKLLCSQKMQQDIGDTDLRLIANEHGTYDIERPVIKNRSYYGYWVHLLLEGLTEDNLQAIFNRTTKCSDSQANKDIISILKIAATDKDCLFLYTEFFKADEETPFEDIKAGAITFINRWIPALLKFRDSNVHNRKTYVAFAVPKYKNMVICNWNGKEIEEFDVVPFDKSENFMKYCHITMLNEFTRELFWK